MVQEAEGTNACNQCLFFYKVSGQLECSVVAEAYRLSRGKQGRSSTFDYAGHMKLAEKSSSSSAGRIAT